MPFRTRDGRVFFCSFSCSILRRVPLFWELLADGPHGSPDDAVVVVPAEVPAAEFQVVRAAVVAVDERPRPVEAVRTCGVQEVVPATASSGEENGIAVRLTGYFISIYAFLDCPFPCTFFSQFCQFSICGHPPITVPIHQGRVIPRTQDGLVIYRAINTICAVLG